MTNVHSSNRPASNHLFPTFKTHPGQSSEQMPEFYQYNEAGNMKESAPTRCPNGHPLGPNTVLVGALPCLCHPPATVHRTWRCTACDACMTRPACSRNPEWTVWPSISPGR